MSLASAPQGLWSTLSRLAVPATTALVLACLNISAQAAVATVDDFSVFKDDQGYRSFNRVHYVVTLSWSTTQSPIRGRRQLYRLREYQPGFTMLVNEDAYTTAPGPGQIDHSENVDYYDNQLYYKLFVSVYEPNLGFPSSYTIYAQDNGTAHVD